MDVDLRVGADAQTVKVEAAAGELAQDPGRQRRRGRRSALGRFASPEWPHAHRPGAHGAGSARQPRRGHRRHEPPVLAARPALGGFHWRQPSQRQLLSAGWRHQYRSDLQHPEPERLAGRGAGVPGADRQLLGGNGRRRRRPDQHRYALGDGHFPRHRLRVPAQWRHGRPLASTKWATGISWSRTILAPRSAAPSGGKGKTFFFVNYEGAAPRAKP